MTETALLPEAITAPTAAARVHLARKTYGDDDATVVALDDVTVDAWTCCTRSPWNDSWGSGTPVFVDGSCLDPRDPVVVQVQLLTFQSVRSRT